MNVLFIINPKSGQRTEDNLTQLIAAEASRMGFEYRVYEMVSGDEEANIRKEINSYTPEVLACAGGDGTVNLAARILSGTDTLLLIIPYGSANGMARELGIRFNNALSLLQKGTAKKIDLLRVNEHTCIHLADVGLNARIVKRFENDTRRGAYRYARHLLAEMFLIKQYRFFIRHDGKEITRKAVSLTIANASRYGTGAMINPNGKLDDGCFELVIVKPFPRIQLLTIAWKMFNGTLTSSEYVEVIHCREAQIRSARKTTLQVDGEVIGKINQIKIEILPGALNVLVPAETK